MGQHIRKAHTRELADKVVPVKETVVNRENVHPKNVNTQRRDSLKAATISLSEAEPVFTSQKYPEELRDLLPVLEEFFEKFKAGIIKRPPGAQRWHKGYGLPHFIGDIEYTGGGDNAGLPKATSTLTGTLGPENRWALFVATEEKATKLGIRGAVPSTWGTIEDWAKAGKKVRPSELKDPVVLVKDEAVSERTKVYNATQLEGYTPTGPPEPKDRTPCLAKSIEDLHNIEGVAIKGYFLSGYDNKNDVVCVLPEGHHEDSLNYMKSLAHEIGHASGHPDRLNRSFDPENPGPDSDYAFEEVVAEITSVIVTNRLLARNSQELGEPSHTDEKSTNQSADYIISHWGHQLRSGVAVEVLQQAISEAERAADWILERTKTLATTKNS